MAVLLSFASPAGSSQQQSGSQQADPRVAAYAQEYSVSQAEAQRRLDRMPELQRILGLIRDAEGSRLAGWGIAHTPSFGAWAELTGTGHPTEFSLSAHYRFSDIDVRTGAAHSYQELQSEQAAFGSRNDPNDSKNNASAIKSGELHKRNMYDAVSYTSIDLGNNAFVVGIDPHMITDSLTSGQGGGAAAAGAAQYKAAALSKAHDIDLAIQHATDQFDDHVDTSFKIVDGRGISHTAALYGGRDMRTSKNGIGYPGCTAGFAAYHKKSKQYGIITAGHCDRSTFQQQGVTLTRAQVAWGAYSDAAFYTIPQGASHTVANKIVCRSTTTGSGPPDPTCGNIVGTVQRWYMKNDYVCHWGTMTKWSCGNVTEISFQPNWENACDKDKKDKVKCKPFFVKVEGKYLKNCAGDSGGPFTAKQQPSSSNRLAYGIVKGSSDVDDCHSGGKRVYFTPISTAETRLGVKLWTDNQAVVK